MPFTFSHPALVLPLKYLPKPYYSLTALIIGSMVPDFEYFIRMKVCSLYSHTLYGVFWLDLPLGLILYITFKHFVRREAVNNLPLFLYRRIPDEDNQFSAQWGVILLSLLLGTFSHVLWDAFTHQNGYFVSRVEYLSKTINIGSVKIKIYKCLQHLSSVVGALIIIVYIFKLPQREIENRKFNYLYWIGVLILALLTLFVRVVMCKTSISYGDIIVSAITGVLIGLLLISIATKFILQAK